MAKKAPVGAISTEGNYIAFQSDPQWSDIVAMLNHYDTKRDEAWAKRQVDLSEKSFGKKWADWTKTRRINLANELHLILYHEANLRGRIETLFAQREEYND